MVNKFVNEWDWRWLELFQLKRLNKNNKVIINKTNRNKRALRNNRNNNKKLKLLFSNSRLNVIDVLVKNDSYAI